MRVKLHTATPEQKSSLFFVDKFMKIVENALWFTFQMDYEKSKKACLMQRGLEMTLQKHI